MTAGPGARGPAAGAPPAEEPGMKYLEKMNHLCLPFKTVKRRLASVTALTGPLTRGHVRQRPRASLPVRGRGGGYEGVLFRRRGFEKAPPPAPPCLLGPGFSPARPARPSASDSFAFVILRTVFIIFGLFFPHRQH